MIRLCRWGGPLDEQTTGSSFDHLSDLALAAGTSASRFGSISHTTKYSQMDNCDEVANSPFSNRLKNACKNACSAELTLLEVAPFEGRKGKAFYTFNVDDQIFVNRWLLMHYRRDKIFNSWRSKPMLEKYGVHVFILLRYDSGNFVPAELLQDELANAVIYGGAGPTED